MVNDLNWPIEDEHDITLWMDDEDGYADPIDEVLTEVSSLLGAFDDVD